MKRKIVISILCLILIIATFSLINGEFYLGKKTIIEKKSNLIVERELTRIAKENKVVGMTVLGYRHGILHTIFNYGYSDLERKIYVDNKTIFYVASITKTITGMAIMKLVEMRKIKSIDDDISKYLRYKVRNPKYPDIPITIKQLMTHTSSLTDNGLSLDFFDASFSDNPPALREVIDQSGKYYNSEIWMNEKPGEKFEYCNFGAVLAGSIVEIVSGLRFDECVNKYIIDPLEMRGGLTIDKIKNIDKVAVIYKLDDNLNPYPRLDNYNGSKPSLPDYSRFIPGRNPYLFGPQGGLRARVRGLEKIMEVFINEGMCYSTKKPVRILKKSTVETMLKTHWKGTGFGGLYKEKGLFIHITEELVPGVRLYGHKGDAFGLMSDMYFNPAQNLGIILIINGGLHSYGESGFYTVEEEIFRSAYRFLSRDVYDE